MLHLSHGARVNSLTHGSYSVLIDFALDKHWDQGPLSDSRNFCKCYSARDQKSESCRDNLNCVLCYQLILGVTVRYIRLAKETHPDTGGDAVVFQDVLLAYRILSNEERRKAFDDSGSDSGDSTEEERKVRLPDLQTLRSAVENNRREGHIFLNCDRWIQVVHVNFGQHVYCTLPLGSGMIGLDVCGRELKWERDMASLAGQVGTVQFDDPEYGITAISSENFHCLNHCNAPERV